MIIVADIVMFAWPAVVLAMFACLPARRAVLVGFVVAFLFLPLSAYKVPFFPDYTKMSATCCAVLLGISIFDFQRIASFRFRAFDLPMAVYCAVPFLSSLTNGLGVYDGASGMVDSIITWGLPYLIGRLYFGDATGIRELAIAIFIGGLVYVPLCLFEIRMSPQLTAIVYGDQGRWYNVVRFGGYRPKVFMLDGLMLAMWMTACSLVGYWLWRTKALSRLRGVSTSMLAPLLILTTVMCRSTGALLLLIVGIAALECSRVLNTRLALWCLLLIAPLYLGMRITGMWDGAEVTAWAGILNKDRAKSFQGRLNNEAILVAKAMEKPVFGWGSWGRNRVYDDWGNDISVTDGRWVIELGQHGLAGLISLYSVMLSPLGLLLMRTPFRRLVSAELAPALSLGVITALYAIDCLPNGMVNPVFILSAGAVVGHIAIGSIINSSAEGAPPSRDSSEKPRTAQVPQRRLTPGSVG